MNRSLLCLVVGKSSRPMLSAVRETSDRFRDELEPLEVLVHVPDKLLLLSPPPVLIGLVLFGFHKSRQVLRRDVPDSLRVMAPVLEEVDVALLRQVPIQKLLHHILPQTRIEAPALRYRELTNHLQVEAGIVIYPDKDLRASAPGQVFLQ